jgi:hypothetical protein
MPARVLLTFQSRSGNIPAPVFCCMDFVRQMLLSDEMAGILLPGRLREA